MLLEINILLYDQSETILHCQYVRLLQAMGIYTMNACLILAGVCLFLLASTCAKPNVSSLVRLVSYEIKAAVLQIILKNH